MSNPQPDPITQAAEEIAKELELYICSIATNPPKQSDVPIFKGRVASILRKHGLDTYTPAYPAITPEIVAKIIVRHTMRGGCDAVAAMDEDQSHQHCVDIASEMQHIPSAPPTEGETEPDYSDDAYLDHYPGPKPAPAAVEREDDEMPTVRTHERESLPTLADQRDGFIRWLTDTCNAASEVARLRSELDAAREQAKQVSIDFGDARKIYEDTIDELRSVLTAKEAEVERLNNRVASLLQHVPDNTTCGDIQKWAAEYAAQRASLAATVERLRGLFASAYSGAALYTDDGELQDSSRRPFIDFKRDSIDDIEKKIAERARTALAPAGEERGE